jgi:hypothetical protein
MTFSLSTTPSSQIIWGVLIILGIILVYGIIRFFWTHILRYLLHGCAAILVIISVLVLLQYFKIIHIPWPF